jgi:hypothetical protein
MRSRPWALLLSGVVVVVLTLLLSGVSAGSTAYLWTWTFWAGLSLGAFALRGMFRLTGGEVGPVLDGALARVEAPWSIFVWLFLPIFFALGTLYPWASPGGRAGLDAHAARFFSPVFFIVRSVVYLAGWSALRRLNRKNPALALVLHVLIATFASIDWAMSLERDWVSTIYGLIFVMSQALGAYAFVLAERFAARERKDTEDSPKRRRDLGNLLLTFAMSWTYLAFMQFLIIWSGDLPRESVWYVDRAHGGWGWVALAIAVGIWAIPMGALLFRKTKRVDARLRAVALVVLGASALVAYWNIAPSGHPAHALPSAADLGCFVGLGAIWIGLRGRSDEAL